MKAFTILLAEENIVTGLFVKRVLQQAGYRVWFCMDIAEAWQYYRDKHPDLVLLDENQPSINGQLANKIRHENKVIPIMLLSGKTFEEELYNKQPGDLGTGKKISEGKLLESLHCMLPLPQLPVTKYDSRSMQLCSAEDILVLTTFFEVATNLRQYDPN